MKDESIKSIDEGAYRIAYLIAGYIRGSLTESEHDELDNWVEANDHNMLFFEELTDEKNIEANLEWLNKTMAERKPELKIQFNPEYKVKTKRWFYSVAASVIILLAAFGIYKKINHKQSNKTSVAKVDQTEMQPGANKATLALSDGSVIDLANLSKGSIKQDLGVTIMKEKEGEIVYHKSYVNGNKAASYNILTTPGGGQYQVQLPDGSEVWLNAASSLKYPTTFATTNRTVELKGEGYFEIAKDKSKPFIVKLIDGSQVKVLGTHFNIMAYENEPSKDVTLLQGSVEVMKGSMKQRLTPGEQARIISSNIIVHSADTEQVTGWKNGQFIFQDANIQSIMRQVARWYNVEIKYQDTNAQHFNATISRNEPLVKLLRILQETNEVHFKLKNKIVYVLP